jgi:transcription elongation factor Elf1
LIATRISASLCTRYTQSPPLPEIAAAEIREKWFPHAKFDHDAHRDFSCLSCHQKALSSTEATDILVPGMVNCKTCHVPGPDHAEYRCFECHTYHDWSMRREVHSPFTLPELQDHSREGN